MYQEYFGFSEMPFHLTPNPRFLFLSKNHREVFAHLLYGIRQRVGFIEVTGEVGTGKTTALRTLFSELSGNEYRLAVIFNPSLTALEMLRAVGREFGLSVEGTSSGELLAILNDFLLRENAAGRTVVLVIDEAQNLEPTVLEQIRLISNLETESDKLIQIVLVGQPELGRLLSRPELRQLSQRISVRYHLRPLDQEDTRAYIVHRLSVAGWKGRRLFDESALKRIFHLSRGLPRLINVYCDRALLSAYAADSHVVTAALVTQAAAELRRVGEGRRVDWLRRWWLPAGVLLLVVLFGLWLSRGGASTPQVQAASVAFDASSALLALDAEQSTRGALDALLRGWRRAPLRDSENCLTQDELADLAQARQLQLLRFRGDLATLLRLDSPVLLELQPAPGQTRRLALLRAEGKEALISPALGGRERIPLDELSRLWTGLAYLPWGNPLALPGNGRFETADEVKALQHLLQQARLHAGPASGRLDSETTRGIERLQQLRGLNVDGKPGPLTLLVLYQEAKQPGFPRLGAVE